MKAARNLPGVAVLASGKVLLVGGGSASQSSAEIYDATTNGWTTIAPAPATLSRGVGLSLPTGKVVFGASIYDAASGTWASATGTPSTTVKSSACCARRWPWCATSIPR